MTKEDPWGEEQAAKRVRKGDISDLVVSDTPDALPQIKPLGKYHRATVVSMDETLKKMGLATPQTPERWVWWRDSVAVTNEVIEQAARVAEEAQRLREEEAAREREKEAEERERLKKKMEAKAAMTPEERERRKERQLLKLVGAVVVKVLSKHQGYLSREEFKKHAQEVCPWEFAMQ